MEDIGFVDELTQSVVPDLARPKFANVTQVSIAKRLDVFLELHDDGLVEVRVRREDLAERTTRHRWRRRRIQQGVVVDLDRQRNLRQLDATVIDQHAAARSGSPQVESGSDVKLEHLDRVDPAEGPHGRVDVEVGQLELDGDLRVVRHRDRSVQPRRIVVVDPLAEHRLGATLDLSDGIVERIGIHRELREMGEHQQRRLAQRANDARRVDGELRVVVQVVRPLPVNDAGLGHRCRRFGGFDVPRHRQCPGSCLREGARRRKPLVGSLGHAARDDVVQSSGQLRDDRSRPRWGLRQVCVEHRRDVDDLERRLPGEHLVQDAGQRVHVALDRDPAATVEPLRRHVRVPARVTAHRRQPGVLLERGEPEVAEIGDVVGVHEDVVGPDVTVYDVRPVRRVERRGDVRGDPLCPFGRQRTVAVDQVAEVDPGDQLGVDVQVSVDLTEFVDGHDVGRIEPQGVVDGPLQPRAEERIPRQLRVEQPQGDHPATLGIEGLVDRARAATADQPLQPVPSDVRTDAGLGRGRSRPGHLNRPRSGR